MEVGFVGLGKMGSAMARNIAKAGHTVRAWNRSAAPGLSAEGLEMVGSARDAFQADAVFTMLSDDAAIRDVVLTPGLLATARPGCVHVVTSTISVAFTEELRAAHAQAGIGYVAAPVFGRPDVAEAAQLNVIVGGKPASVETVRPLLEAIGRKVWVMGEEPRQANAAKIAGNMMIAMAIEAMAEAVAITGANGLEPAPFFELITQTLFAGRSYETYSAKIAKQDYEPGFRMRLGLKDLGLAAQAAEAAGKALPQLQGIRTRMAQATEAGLGERDWSAVAGFEFGPA